MSDQTVTLTAEDRRLQESAARTHDWQRWGPYLSERQWGTVREDYSSDGSCWSYFPHDHAHSRAYRWGEDGLLGICDRKGRLCFSLALWNEADPFLKERLFGLTNGQGNHGEDVKELYYYLDSTPTHSYMKALYKYPQRGFPYQQLVEENAARGKGDPEFEVLDTGVFRDNRYFDVIAEYAKASANDLLIRITVANRGPEQAALHLLPTLWFYNTWFWGCTHEGCTMKPSLRLLDDGAVYADHETLGAFCWLAGPGPDGRRPELLFTENETNMKRLFGVDTYTPYVKDAFHTRLIEGREDAVNPHKHGTKAAAWYRLQLAAGEEITLDLRLSASEDRAASGLGEDFDDIFAQRRREADEFYDTRLPRDLSEEERNVGRRSYAGLLWTKQFYQYVVSDWLDGDRDMPTPPRARQLGRNRDWRHVYIRSVLSMPDKWEYPWFAAWDLAFHMLPLAHIDAEFAKDQLQRLLREWFMHPNGQIPAYEFAFGDVNPPVHAWACWRVYKIAAAAGHRDRKFLDSCFQKLLLNFTWWVNRKDRSGNHLFAGGFLGLDNIGVFDRSQPLPGGGYLHQADGTAWMAFYCGTMLAMALELEHEDMASKFFEHFVQISDAINDLGGTGLWDESDGLYYDLLNQPDGSAIRLRIRSLVGMIPLCAAEVIESDVIDKLPGFKRRMEWFLRYRRDLADHITFMDCTDDRQGDSRRRYLLAIPAEERLRRVLEKLLDEREFLSPYGIRSLSRHHEDHPYVLDLHDQHFTVGYVPGESQTAMFGGNSNWRGPIWFPINYLLIEALERYHHFYGDRFQVEFPTGSGNRMTLAAVADELHRRLTRLFIPDDKGHRPVHGGADLYDEDPHFRDLVLFYEYFHPENGRGCGAAHQTGWTSLVNRCLERVARRRQRN